MASSYYLEDALANEAEDNIFASLENLSPLHNGFPELMFEQHQTETTSKNQEVSLEKATHLPNQAQTHIAESSNVIYWANPSRGKISREAITSCFHLPAKQTAQVLEFEELSNNPGNIDREKVRNAISLLENRRQLLQNVPDLPLELETKRLGKVLHNANYKRRKKSRISESSSSAVERQPSLPCPIDPLDQEQ